MLTLSRVISAITLHNGETANRHLYNSGGEHGRRDTGVSGIPFVVGRANYLETPRGEIVGERIGFLKLLFHREDMRLLGVYVIARMLLNWRILVYLQC